MQDTNPPTEMQEAIDILRDVVADLLYAVSSHGLISYQVNQELVEMLTQIYPDEREVDAE